MASVVKEKSSGFRRACFTRRDGRQLKYFIKTTGKNQATETLDGAKDERTHFVAVLEIPPVVSAETAVRVQIVKDVRKET